LTSAAGEQQAAVSLDPGLDRHEWETRMQDLEEELETAPAEALPALADLIEQVLNERGYTLDDPVAREGEDREVVSEYLAAREIADAVERASADVGPGDVAAAINGLVSLYEYVVGERRAP